MAVSRKKTVAKKPSRASKKKASPAAKKSARSKGKSTKQSTSKAKPPARTQGPKQASRIPKKTGDAGEAEKKLARALLEIRRLKEDRDNQVAIAEAAELENSMVLEQLKEAEEKLRDLEHQQAEKAIQTQAAIPPGVGDEEDVDFEEEEPEGDTDDLDDVDAIYGRLDDPRVRRQELDRERLDRESEAGDEPYWMICPKCGDTLEEVDAEDLKLERCDGCAGIYLDHGEVEMLLMLARGPDGLRRVNSALRV